MNTDIEYLKTLEQDLAQAGKREQWMESSRRKPRRSRVSWGTFAAAIVPVLVVAGLIGWLATGGVEQRERQRRCRGRRRVGPTATHRRTQRRLLLQANRPLISRAATTP